MPWGKITWNPHGYKHFARGKKLSDWPDIVRGTGEKKRVAKYGVWLSEQQIRQLEESLVEHQVIEGKIVLTRGRPVFTCGDFTFVYMICDGEVGASLGKRTDIVLVQWDETEPGTLHGQPVTEEELKQELQGNDEEWAFYKQWRRSMREIR